VLDAIERVEGWGVTFVDPRIEEGKAKIAGTDAIALETARAAGAAPLSGEHVIVTAGATAEPIDDVRVLTSRASGKTGRAVARSCYARGADVTLVHGPGAIDGDVPWADLRRVTTAADMLEAVQSVAGDADALVSAAAIGDYTVDAADGKIRSGRENLTLSLRPTPKLIDAVRADHPDLPIVGFKVESGAEDGDLTGGARRIMDRAGLAFVVANDASVMGAAETRAVFVSDAGEDAFEGTKAELGLQVADRLADVL
jgi:phosphopantothenoylcysteine decarboxylase/phosphopantothenate--cysteine ligase